jgi:hypothetical protein
MNAQNGGSDMFDDGFGKGLSKKRKKENKNERVRSVHSGCDFWYYCFSGGCAPHVIYSRHFL